jgi:hypothetical protein
MLALAPFPLPSRAMTDTQQADDELDMPYLKGFEWDREMSFTKFLVHFQREGAPVKKSKKSKKDEE